MTAMGLGTYNKFFVHNRLRYFGSEWLKKLPRQEVLFVSNHETYFAEAIGVYHMLAGWNPLKNYPNIHVVADQGTMKKNWLTRYVMSKCGIIPVARTWKDGDRFVERPVRTEDQEAVGYALERGWVLSFPQGTTQKYAPVRKGTAHIIKEYKPIVVPLIIDGFEETFHKSSLQLKKARQELTIRIKKPLDINYNDSIEDITNLIAMSIGQSKEDHERHRLTASQKKEG